MDPLSAYKSFHWQLKITSKPSIHCCLFETSTVLVQLTVPQALKQVKVLVQLGLNSMIVYAASALPLYVQANGFAIVRL
jgi:hypothetical protein